MSRDFLGEYGPDRSNSGSRGSNQGRTMRDVNNYRPPQGPTNITDPKSPGLHGNNYDYCGSQGKASLPAGSSGRPGIGGKVCPSGSQDCD